MRTSYSYSFSDTAPLLCGQLRISWCCLRDKALTHAANLWILQKVAKYVTSYYCFYFLLFTLYFYTNALHCVVFKANR